MHTFIRLAAVGFLAWLCSVSAWGQQAAAADKTDPQAVLEATRHWIRELAKEHVKAAVNVANRCGKPLLDADNMLLTADSKDAAKFSELAETATTEHDRCDRAKAVERRVNDTQADANKLLRQLALDLKDCKPDIASSCLALQLGPQILTLRASSIETMLALGKVETSSVQTLVQAASTAQERVGKQKTAVADAYSRGDVAAAAALAASAPGAIRTEPAAVGSRVEPEKHPSANSYAAIAFEQAAEARKAASEAQHASNTFVGAALKLLRDCSEPKLKDCDKNPDATTLAQATASEKAMNRALEKSKASYERAKLASYGVEASKFAPDEMARAVRFLRALDDNPDAKSLVGGTDSYKFTAGTGGAGLAIKLVGSTLGSDWYRSGSIIISTPAEKSGDSSIYKSADGFSKSSSIELARTFVNRPGLKSGKDDISLLYQTGFALKVGHERLDYVDPSRLSEESKKTLVPWGISLYGAFSPLFDKDAAAKSTTLANAFYAKVSRQQQVEENESKITCPVAVNDGGLNVQSVVHCATGPLGAPRLVSAWQFQLEYRFKNEVLPDMSLVLKHNVTAKGKDAVTNINLPIYLLKQASDSKSPIHAGINFGWSNKGGGTSFGIFLGAPLSLYAFDR